jgi:hypothetical protein
MPASGDVKSCGSSKNGSFGGTYRFHLQGEKNQRAMNNVCNVLQLLVIANAVPSARILFTLKMEAILSSETSAIIRATWRHIPETEFYL